MDAFARGGRDEPRVVPISTHGIAAAPRAPVKENPQMSRSLPEDPLIRSLVIQARRAQVSRRTMLQGAGIGAAALTLAACSSGGDDRPSPATDNSKNDPTLTWANWSLYLDEDRKSTRLNSSHVKISYAVFCLKKKKQKMR